MRVYGTAILTVTSPPQAFEEPLTLAQVKQFLELPPRSPVDSDEDAMLQGFISAARSVAEGFQKRDLVRKQYDLYLDDLCGEIQVYGPLVSVDLVQYRDSDGNYTVVPPDTGYIVDPFRGLIIPPYGGSWPSFTSWPSSAVLIRYTSGLASTSPFWAAGGDGHHVMVGMKHLISHWFNGRLPFEANHIPIEQYPWTVTNLLQFGAVPSLS
jgi:hypothetical protein